MTKMAWSVVAQTFNMSAIDVGVLRRRGLLAVGIGYASVTTTSLWWSLSSLLWSKPLACLSISIDASVKQAAKKDKAPIAWGPCSPSQTPSIGRCWTYGLRARRRPKLQCRQRFCVGHQWHGGNGSVHQDGDTKKRGSCCRQGRRRWSNQRVCHCRLWERMQWRACG